MLDLYKMLLPDGDEMSQDNIDFVVDAHIKSAVEQFWLQPEAKMYAKLSSVFRFFHPKYKTENLTIEGGFLDFYGANWELVKERAEISFARYDLIQADFISSRSEVEHTKTIRFSYSIKITPELRQKYMLANKAPTSNNFSSIKPILKV